ncbi:Hsp20/alpha crystallin family protein [Roseibacterium sp. SDUM158017]|uniref:Hsp20/alpha crystallin family protein n=1 Tax=Roseicyclus salinarum TaxID=3036773 RepID=UPI002414D81A|nr:Hsp20/alpha crystallin family protein [Roseibacterium sp. SDUM158017]MDG4648103.1 Hsp20/alpha crystallin family protein [Roseibacterium sp. SDUM158017]
MVESSHKSGQTPSLWDPFRSIGSQIADWFAPASEASSDGSAYRIAVELPGVRDKDVDVSLGDGVVTVTGQKSSEREEKGETWFFSERSYGSFSRSFRLPPDADEAKIEATLKDGLLTILVPRKAGADAETARKVKIKKA